MLVLESNKIEANIIHSIKTLEESKTLFLLELITITPINTQKTFIRGSQLEIFPLIGSVDTNRNVITKNIIILNNLFVTFRTSEVINTTNNKTS